MGLLVDGRGQDEWYDTKSTGGGLSGKTHSSATG